MVSCFLCVKKELRPSSFFGYFKFWIEAGKVVYAHTDDFSGYFRMCKECAGWSAKNHLAASELIYVRILALEKDQEDDSE